jgi:hypothetical protein
LVVYGVAAYSMNLELSLNIAASIECRFRRIPARYSELMPAGIPI